MLIGVALLLCSMIHARTIFGSVIVFEYQASMHSHSKSALESPYAVIFYLPALFCTRP